MTKKRHWPQYSKPQTTAPHSLESSGLQSSLHHDEPQSRSVNDLLASLRRTSLSTGAGTASGAGGGSSLAAGSRMLALPAVPVVSPSVPPEIAHILLPLPPNGGGGALDAAPAAHALHAHGGVGANGGGMGAGAVNGVGAAGGGRRRPPAGPAPPPSWLSQSRHAPRRIPPPDGRWGDKTRKATPHSGRIGVVMPGIVRPANRSLVDVILRRMVIDWEIQKHFNQYYLLYLQGPLKAALVSYLGQLNEDGKGVSIGDLKVLLLPPRPPSPADAFEPRADDGHNDGSSDNEGGNESGQEYLPCPSTLNEDFRYLDLTWSVGHSLSIRELSDLLFPGKIASFATRNSHSHSDTSLLDSWDAPGTVSPPRLLLPNLTHLSLALTPDRTSHVSWRQLLAFAAHLPMLTHLSLAYWPEPTLTPNAKLATMVSPQGRRFQYGGTGPYSHSLDNDWAEAVMLVRRLSKAMYGLEYLDLTGCASWFPALMHRVDNGQVDWVGDWGKMTMLVLSYGTSSDVGPAEEVYSGEPEQRLGDVARQVNAASEARLIERHIRQQRAGRGRFITVVSDKTVGTTR